MHLSRQRAQKAHRRMEQSQAPNTISFTQAPKAAPRRIDLIPRTRNQEQLVLALQDPGQHIVVTAGPAGTGKTYLAMLAAIKALKEGACERIVMTRPAVGVEGEQHGFLPGNLVAKMEPWTRPLLRHWPTCAAGHSKIRGSSQTKCKTQLQHRPKC